MTTKTWGDVFDDFERYKKWQKTPEGRADQRTRDVATAHALIQQGERLIEQGKQLLEKAQRTQEG